MQNFISIQNRKFDYFLQVISYFTLILVLFIATNVSSAKRSLWELASTAMSVMILICVMAVMKREAFLLSKLA